MSGTRKTYRGRMSDGQIVQVRNSAWWDVYSFAKDGEGKWHDVLAGTSVDSVSRRTRTRLGHYGFEICLVSEILPTVIQDYFDTVHPGTRIRITSVFAEGHGRVTEFPGGSWAGSAEYDRAWVVFDKRPTVSYLKLLLKFFPITEICVNGADFQISELGLGRVTTRKVA